MSWITIARDGGVRRVALARTGEGVWVGWSGRSAYFARDRGRGAAAIAPLAPGHDEVRAPMTGKVVAVTAAPGDAVEVGGLLVVLEAMKMEYRLLAPRAGMVEAVHCRVGDLVDLGKTLVRLTAGNEIARPG